jgi:hypothetical protein
MNIIYEQLLYLYGANKLQTLCWLIFHRNNQYIWIECSDEKHWIVVSAAYESVSYVFSEKPGFAGLIPLILPIS